MTMRRLAFGLVLFPLVILAAFLPIRPVFSTPCDCNGGDNQNLTEDGKLIHKVQIAARGQVSPQRVERFVGKEATCNTLRRLDFVGACWTRIIPDQPCPNIMECLKRGGVLVFWHLPNYHDETRIIGILWEPAGRVIRFVAILRPL